MSAPQISVLVGVYYRRNDLDLLERSVRSVLEQSVTEFELLVCDDGSTAEARRFLEQTAEQDSRLRLIRPGNCIALAPRLNACLKEARGQFLARMDDDDYSCRERFSRQLLFLKEHPEVSFVGSNAVLWRGGKNVGVRIFPESPEVRDFFFTQPYLHPSLMFRREALLAVGGYEEDSRCILCEDYDLLLRLYATGRRGMNLQENLLFYTVSDTVKGNRKMCHRWNESVTRCRRFRELGVLPEALPYVVKPLVVGMLPEPILKGLKRFFV